MDRKAVHPAGFIKRHFTQWQHQIISKSLRISNLKGSLRSLKCFVARSKTKILGARKFYARGQIESKGSRSGFPYCKERSRLASYLLGEQIYCVFCSNVLFASRPCYSNGYFLLLTTKDSLLSTAQGYCSTSNHPFRRAWGWSVGVLARLRVPDLARRVEQAPSGHASVHATAAPVLGGPEVCALC